MGLFQNAEKKSRLVCENCMLQVERKILTRNNFLRRFSFLKVNSEIVPKLFELSVSLLSDNSVKTVFLCPCQCSKYTYTFWQKFIDPYCFLFAVRKCLTFWQKNFGKVVITSFHMSTKTLEAVIFLVKKFLRIIFEVWAENILMFVKTFFFEVEIRWTFPERNFLLLKILITTFGIWTKLCAISGQKFCRSVKFPYYISIRFLERKVM